MTENNALKIKVLVYVSHPLAILWEQKSIGANSFLEILPRIKKSYLNLEADFDNYFFGQRDRIKFHPEFPETPKKHPEISTDKGVPWTKIIIRLYFPLLLD